MLGELAADTLVTLSSVVCTGVAPTEYVSYQSLQGTQLQNLSTSSVADALKFFSGVQIKDYGGLGGQKTINVRSMGTQHVGVFIDGVRITNCQNGTVDLGKYSLQNMESVELYNANKTGVLLSASEYASAATVYLSTKRPQNTELKIMYSNGSFSTNRIQFHGSLKKRAFLDVELLKTVGNYKFRYKSEYEDTIGKRRNSDIRYLRAEGGYFSDHFKGHVYFYASDRGLPGGVVKRLSDKYRDIGREQDYNFFVQGTYTDDWDKWALRINSKFASDKLHATTDFLENQNSARYDNTYLQTDFYNSVVVGYKSKYLDGSISTDLRKSDLQCNVYGMKYVYRVDLKSAAALQFHYQGFNLSGSCLYTNVKDHSEMPTADRLQRWTPSISMLYKFDSGIALRAFYKNIFRAPTLNDLYYTHVGRRDLKPERTNQWDLGVSYKDEVWNIQSDLYWNTVTDKIICVPQGSAYDWRMINRGYVKSHGWDTSVRYSQFHWGLFGTVSYQDVRDLTDKGDKSSYNHQLMYSPEWSFTVVGTWDWKGFSGSLSHMYVARRWWSYASEDDVLGAYNCTDLKLKYQFKWVSLSIDVNNLFNQYYELIQRWPLPARRYMATLIFNL